MAENEPPAGFTACDVGETEPAVKHVATVEPGPVTFSVKSPASAALAPLMTTYMIQSGSTHPPAHTGKVIETEFVPSVFAVKFAQACPEGNRPGRNPSRWGHHRRASRSPYTCPPR